MPLCRIGSRKQPLPTMRWNHSSCADNTNCDSLAYGRRCASFNSHILIWALWGVLSTAVAHPASDRSCDKRHSSVFLEVLPTGSIWGIKHPVQGTTWSLAKARPISKWESRRTTTLFSWKPYISTGVLTGWPGPWGRWKRCFTLTPQVISEWRCPL